MYNNDLKNKSFVTCVLMGGLGNQLFQIFTTIAYGLKINCEIIFPYSETLEIGITRITYWNTFLSCIRKYTTLIDNRFTNNELMSFPLYKEDNFHYEELPQNPYLKQNLLLFGYFQSYKYFEQYKNEIFSMIKLKTHQENMEYLYSQYFDNQSISMHFRLGDYKYVQDIHPILPYDYYCNALRHILSCRKQISYRVLYFCEKDDIIEVSDTISKLMKEFRNVEFIKVDDTIDDWQQMLIMSCCNDNIIANSSFSWWGSYFNQKENKIVCYPSQWFGDSSCNDTVDLFPSDWKKIYF